MNSIKYIYFFWTLINVTSLSDALLDFYLNATETWRLLGIEGEVYYVRDGLINHYALTFRLPIKKSIHEIWFTWKNTHKESEPAIYYNMNITVSDSRSMSMPIASIPKDGAVPTQIEGFSITLPCTGAVTADVNIIIQINLTNFANNGMTTLSINRKKTCYEGEKYDHNLKNLVYTNGNVSYVYSDEDDESLWDALFSESSTILYISIGCTCLLILLITVIGMIVYKKTQKKKEADCSKNFKRPLPNSYATYIQRSDTSSSQGPSGYTMSDTPQHDYATMTSGRRIFTPILEMSPEDVHTSLAEIHVNKECVSFRDIVMEGSFGRVYTGIVKTSSESQNVIIKTVNDQATMDQIYTMLHESITLKNISNPNVHSILYSCLDNMSQPYLIFPCTLEGNLKNFLHRCKIAEITSSYSLNTQQLLYMAIQMARGLQILHKKKILHNDIAARNFVVDSQLIVKVSDTALSRDLFPNDYSCLGDNENRPVKWLALEALTDHLFSPASDAWSFGITVWELMSLGQQPYNDLDPYEMANFLRKGFRLTQPSTCPDELFVIIGSCWSPNCDDRPKFSQLVIYLQDLYKSIGHFV